MNILEWAEQEIKLACDNEKKDEKDSFECKYACLCYESALNAYKKAIESLEKDGHSGYSYGATVNVLKHLLDEKPLSPLSNTDDDWVLSRVYDDSIKNKCPYIHKRLPSLYKDIYADGSVKIYDLHRIICVDTNHSSITFTSSVISNIIDEMYPITFPYYPEKIYVYCEDFLYDEKNGDFDTIGILNIKKEYSDVEEVNIFLKENLNGCGWIKISKEEYINRKNNAVKEP